MLLFLPIGGVYFNLLDGMTFGLGYLIVRGE